MARPHLLSGSVYLPDRSDGSLAINRWGARYLSEHRTGSILPTWIVPEGGVPMKRVKAACILQTLAFSQKDDAGFTKVQALQINREEVNRYKRSLERTSTRHQILDETEQEDGSILLHVRKQYNDRVDVSEYFV